MLFSGSMNATPKMLEYVERAVTKAAEKGYLIVCGDNPNGVDLQVVKTCERLKNGYMVVSLEYERRVFKKLDGLQVSSKFRYEDYHARDTEMIDFVDECMFIWDGKSRGTITGFEYAKLADQKCHLINFKTGRAAIESYAPVPYQAVIEPTPKQKKLF